MGLKMDSFIELFMGEHGKYIMVGFMVGASAGYGFSTKTSLSVAREQIKELREQNKLLKEQVDSYVQMLIGD